MLALPNILALTWPLRLEYLMWWQALLLFAALATPITLMALWSLAGLGPVRRWVALGIRLAVLLLLVLIIGGARWQRENKIVEVIVLRDMSESVSNVHNYPGTTLQTSIEQYLKDVSKDSTEENGKAPDDRIGLISFQSNAVIDAIPNTSLPLDTHPIREVGRGTDVASAIQLALATLSKDAMHRLVLVWDGNATQGDLRAALEAAAAQHVPIDVMPLRYDVKNEVLVDRFIAPSLKRENERFTIDVILRSTNPGQVTGKLTVLHNDEPMDLDPAPGIQTTRTVTLKPEPARNVEHVDVPELSGSASIHKFRAIFEAPNVTAQVGNTTPGAAGAMLGDTLTQNNAAEAFTFVMGKGKVLYIDNVPDGAGNYLRKALTDQGITLDAERIGVDNFPRSLVELQNYDAVILANVPRGAGGLDNDQEKMLASYVHDMGGGLVMIGGEDAFGAGGWQGSKLEEILPVNMDIPSQRQMPKGALVLIMHSCEMPDGNYWGEQCAIKGIETLSARDEIGVISYGWGGGGGGGTGGSQWDFPLGEKGDGAKVVAAVKNMKLGDMPSFDDSMNVALNGINGGYGLLKSDARQKHVIIISDGDPAAPQNALSQAYFNAKVSVSTVSVYPHDKSDRGLPPTMQKIAADLKGRAYGPVESNPNQLPQIFIKEATVVRRSLIQDGSAMSVRLNQNSTSEMIKGLTELPDVTGIVLTSKKENPTVDMPLVTGKNSDPLLAHWQTGLGRSAVWTSDAMPKWAAKWVASGEFEKFWAQVVRAVARPPMSGDFDVRTVQDGEKGKIVIEALKKDSAFLNFLSVDASVVGPDFKTIPVRFVQTGPGTYESQDFDASQPGTYVVLPRYRSATESGMMPPAGLVVNSSPELRDLKSNDAAINEVLTITGGRMLDPFDAAGANLFTRIGLLPSASPLPIWDILIPILLGMIIIDVATRRIAWDWLSTKRMATAGADYVRSYTTVRKVESMPTLDALKRVREEVAEQKFKVDEGGYGAAAPDPRAKFEAGKGVDGDITDVVGGATNKAVPPPPKKIEPKGITTPGGHMGSLMEAKRRAQQKMKEDEQKDG